MFTGLVVWAQSGVTVKHNERDKTAALGTTTSANVDYLRRLTVNADSKITKANAPADDSGMSWSSDFSPATENSVTFENRQIANAVPKKYTPLFSGRALLPTGGGGGGGSGPSDYPWTVTGNYKITCDICCPQPKEKVHAIAVKSNISAGLGEFDSVIHSCSNSVKRHQVSKSGLSSDGPAEITVKCEANPSVTDAAEICSPSKCDSLGTLWVVETKIVVAGKEGTKTGADPAAGIPKVYIRKGDKVGISLTYALSSLACGKVTLGEIGRAHV